MAEDDDEVAAEYETLERLRRDVEQLAADQVVVFGDVMLDRHVYGTVVGVASDAPVPAMTEQRRVLTAGATAHTAAGLISLGLRPRLFGVVGKDTSAEKVCRLLLKSDISTKDIATIDGRATTIKTRFIAERPNLISRPQQLLRVDRGVDDPLSPDQVEGWLREAAAAVRSSRVLCVLDYGKGVVTEGTIEPLMEAASRAGVPVVFDPKLTGLHLAEGARVVLFATRGLEIMQRRLGADAAATTAQQLIAEHGWASLLELGGPGGVTLHTPDDPPLRLPARVADPQTLLGMHDAAAVAISAALCRDLSLKDAARLANAACELTMRAESSEQAAIDRRTLATWIDEVAWQMRISQR